MKKKAVIIIIACVVVLAGIVLAYFTLPVSYAGTSEKNYIGVLDEHMYDDEITKKLKSAYSFSNCRGNCKYKSHTVSSEQLVKYKGETYFLCRVSIDTVDKSGKDYWGDSCELLVKAK